MTRIMAGLLVFLLLAGAAPAYAQSTAAPDATAAVAAMAAAYTPEQLLAQWLLLGDLLRENGNYPFVELQKGDTGGDVRALQTRLAELGYYKKEIVDNFGNGTYSALRAFEKANGLKVDGVASAKDQQVLYGADAKAASANAAATGKNMGNADATSGATTDN